MAPRCFQRSPYVKGFQTGETPVSRSWVSSEFQLALLTRIQSFAYKRLRVVGRAPMFRFDFATNSVVLCGGHAMYLQGLLADGSREHWGRNGSPTPAQGPLTNALVLELFFLWGGHRAGLALPGYVLILSGLELPPLRALTDAAKSRDSPTRIGFLVLFSCWNPWWFPNKSPGW